jgi:hypothetical protein
MWWSGWPWYEGHTAAGATLSGTAWAVADGRHGGAAFDETYILIGNTAGAAGQVRLTLVTDTGAPSIRDLPIAAGGRLTVNAGALFGVTDGRFSVIIEGLGSPALPLVVDYARYRSVNGLPFSGGGAAPAVLVTAADAAPAVIGSVRVRVIALVPSRA